MSRYVRQRFSFDELDLPLELAERGVDDPDRLPGYFYRDDGLRLWNAISKYCDAMLGLFYADDTDVVTDGELQVS
jgi:arachidonate 5-lipoxygenase